MAFLGLTDEHVGSIDESLWDWFDDFGYKFWEGLVYFFSLLLILQ